MTYIAYMRFGLKILLPLFISVIMHSILLAQQNLVPNPGFELYDTCPFSISQVHFATSWSMYANATPDYFNSCDLAGGQSVPANGFGYQPAFDGNAYCGFFCFGSNNYREIIGAQLLSPLVVGKKYFVSLRVCAAPIPGSEVMCNGIGVKFLSSAYNISNPVPINNSSHVYCDTIITDSVKWTTISGYFVADAPYEYIALGNFFADGNTDTIGYPSIQGYYFVDGVSVTEAVVSISNIFTPNGDGINDLITTDTQGLADYEWAIYDRWGDKVYQYTPDSTGWDGTHLNGNLCNDGVYYYIFSGIATDGQVWSQSGFIQLIR